MPGGAGNAGQQPSEELPIPANPPVTAAHVRTVAGWVLLVQLHIAQQTRPGVTPFQKIVAEDPVLGKTPLERQIEGIHVIDALADERPLTEQVLVDIGYGPRIGIDAGIAPAQRRIPRPVHAGQAHGNPRLKDPVSLADAPPVLVVSGDG